MSGGERNSNKEKDGGSWRGQSDKRRNGDPNQRVNLWRKGSKEGILEDRKIIKRYRRKRKNLARERPGGRWWRGEGLAGGEVVDAT